MNSPDPITRPKHLTALCSLLLCLPVLASAQDVTTAPCDAVAWGTGFAANLRCAELGHATAQLNLGIMYANGEGVSVDDVEAVRWYRLAAEQGLAVAQFNLGFMYEG